MKAVVLTEPGGIDKLEVTDLPLPAPQKGEVVIKVRALSINPVDMKTRKGAAQYAKLKEEPPVILGWDISGEVTEVGEGVTAFQAGDAVFGMVNFPGHGRAYAEYVAAPAAHLARKPTALSHVQAAASTLALLTAWQVLAHEAKVQPGERVLVHAAAGGVGHFGVQVAKHLGSYVIGTASATNATFCWELGTDQFLDYHQEAFERSLHDIDVVFDTVGGTNPQRSLAILRKGGRMVTIAGGLTDEVKEQAAAREVKAWPYMVHSSGEDMQHLAGLLQLGIIQPYVSNQYRLEEIREAHRQIESGHTRGKIVVVL
ncbi:NADP-dependent oxidoreductase [Paraflavisolibacter sp. H34]|uniref:NADP-dependent oxidoreductase n=1 Tax=Huijunlia imazamoxiresistens TaxID=3127457 RepID=UPI003019C3CD